MKATWPRWGGPEAPTGLCQVAVVCELCGHWTALICREGRILCRQGEMCAERARRWPHRGRAGGAELADFLERLRRS